MLKTNDCLRHIDKILGTPLNTTTGTVHYTKKKSSFFLLHSFRNQFFIYLISYYLLCSDCKYNCGYYIQGRYGKRENMERNRGRMYQLFSNYEQGIGFEIVIMVDVVQQFEHS